MKTLTLTALSLFIDGSSQGQRGKCVHFTFRSPVWEDGSKGKRSRKPLLTRRLKAKPPRTRKSAVGLKLAQFLRAVQVM
jgi:hypothetical protein